MYANPAGGAEIVPIASLNPYNPRWVIKARVTSKGETRQYVNQRGEGKLFAIELLDAAGTAIKATFFNKAVDMFQDFLQVGSVYTFSGGRKGTNRMTNEGELTFDERSVITNVPDDSAIKSNFYGSFTKVSKIQDLPPESKCDVIGVVTAVKPAQQLRSKAGRDLVKRDVTIMDDTLTSIDLTLWGEQAREGDDHYLADNPIICVRACRVSDFAGRALSTTFDSKNAINPDGPDAAALRQWYSSVGAASTATALSVRGGGGAGGGRDVIGYLSDIDSDALTAGFVPGANAASQFVTVRAWVTYLRQNNDRVPWYTACPREGCNKKVELDESTGKFWCEKCRESYDSNEPRYMLSFAIADSTASRFVSAFNEEGAILLGMRAPELKAQADHDDRAIARAFADGQYKQWEFRLRAKPETGLEDQTTVRVQVMRVAPVNYGKEAHAMLAAIAAYD